MYNWINSITDLSLSSIYRKNSIIEESFTYIYVRKYNFYADFCYELVITKLLGGFYTFHILLKENMHFLSLSKTELFEYYGKPIKMKDPEFYRILYNLINSFAILLFRINLTIYKTVMNTQMSILFYKNKKR